MEAAAAKLVWTETENRVHSLGRLPLLAPAPKAKSEHLGLLHQHFRKEQLHWLPSLQVYRPKNHRGSGNDENSWVTSWVVVLAVTCRSTFLSAGPGKGTDSDVVSRRIRDKVSSWRRFRREGRVV